MRRRPGECAGRVPRGIASRGYARAGAIPACSRGRVFQVHPATGVVVAVGNLHRATSSSRRIPSRRARAVYTGRTMRRATRASRRRVPNASLAARRAPAGTTPEPAHRGGWANRRRAEPRRRDDARCAGAGCGRSTPWGGTHHVCYVRLCVLALRGVKLRGVACGAGDVLVFLLAGNPSYVFPLFSRTLVQSEIPQLSN